MLKVTLVSLGLPEVLAYKVLMVFLEAQAQQARLVRKVQLEHLVALELLDLMALREPLVNKALMVHLDSMVVQELLVRLVRLEHLELLEPQARQVLMVRMEQMELLVNPVLRAQLDCQDHQA